MPEPPRIENRSELVAVLIPDAVIAPDAVTQVSCLADVAWHAGFIVQKVESRYILRRIFKADQRSGAERLKRSVVGNHRTIFSSSAMLRI